MRGPPVRRAQIRIAREQVPLGAGPQTKKKLGWAAPLKKVGITVPRKESRAAAQTERPAPFVIRFGNLQCPDIRLVITEALMLGGVLRSQLDGHAGRSGNIDHGLVHAFGVHIDFHLATAVGDRFKERLPERKTSFRYPALA